MHAMALATIGAALRAADLDAGDSRALLRAALGVDDAHLAAHPEQVLTAEQDDRFAGWVRRRRAGEPVAYITGEREFWSLSFHVTPAVLIPRPETELLVEFALERVADGAPAGVLDLGTGCGCVAVAVAKHRPRARVAAIDISPAALAIAGGNAARHDVSVEFIESDWLNALAGRRFDLIVANPPYVAAGDQHLAQGDVRFEPRAALGGGGDGLECIAAIVAQSRAHLERGGWLFVEHGHDQAARCRALLQAQGYQDVMSRRDLAGIERASGGRFDGGRGETLE
jgi:release factor glutamine methyltransferase